MDSKERMTPLEAYSVAGGGILKGVEAFAERLAKCADDMAAACMKALTTRPESKGGKEK